MQFVPVSRGTQVEGMFKMANARAEKDEPKMNGASKVLVNGCIPRQLFEDRRTRHIIKLLFCNLCPSCRKSLREVDREVSRLGDVEDIRLIQRVIHLLVNFIREHKHIDINLEDFCKKKWAVHAGTMYSEFTRVVQTLFSEKKHWGRVIMFLGFAVSFAIYLEDQMVQNCTDSVLEWTCQVIEEDLGHFYLDNNGWVSIY